MLAYLDGNSASMITQAVVAGAAGAAVVAKTGWKRITSPFRGKDSKQADASAASEASAASSWDTPGGEG
ncbi:MAG: hypothetical protein QOE24_2459 [Frankiales bacterium]|jgi:hypothetical protein|nr:hypothetical protein [Frankiales bacterium]MDX6210068.1 hypothetical protein [Frankiales bacterium]MDX6222237.1 hypothetical protein [Frankiales bacterium]